MASRARISVNLEASQLNSDWEGKARKSLPGREDWMAAMVL